MCFAECTGYSISTFLYLALMAKFLCEAAASVIDFLSIGLVTGFKTISFLGVSVLLLTLESCLTATLGAIVFILVGTLTVFFLSTFTFFILVGADFLFLTTDLTVYFLAVAAFFC